MAYEVVVVVGDNCESPRGIHGNIVGVVEGRLRPDAVRMARRNGLPGEGRHRARGYIDTADQLVVIVGLQRVQDVEVGR